MQFVLVSSSFALVLGIALVWVVREVALHFKLHDAVVGGRNLHTRPTPRLGGIAMVLAFAITIGVVLLSGRRMANALAEGTDLLNALLFGGAIIVVAGLLDDLYGIRSWTKLAAQIAAALVACYAGVTIDLIGIPLYGPVHFGWLSIPVTVFWIVAVINGLNLIDGMDGLAGSVIVLSGTTICLMMLVDGSLVDALVLGALVGATCGFLVFNANPASIFMGDTGSLFSGYVLAIVAAHGSQKSTAVFSLLGAILALGLPLADLTLAVVRRGLSGGGLFTADQHHIHHRLLYRGMDQRQAMLVLFGSVVGLEVLALVFVYSNGPVSAVALTATVPIIYAAFQLLGYPAVIRSNRRRALMLDVEDIAHERVALLDSYRQHMRACNDVDEAWDIACGCAPDFGFVALTWHPDESSEPFAWSAERSADERDVHLESLSKRSHNLQTPNFSAGLLELTRNAEAGVFAPFDDVVERQFADTLAMALASFGDAQQATATDTPSSGARPA